MGKWGTQENECGKFPSLGWGVCQDYALTHIEKGKLFDELALNPSSTELSSTPVSGAATQNRPTNRRETSDAPISGGKDTKLLSILQVNEQEIAKKITMLAR